jgi:hypothetical protein
LKNRARWKKSLNSQAIGSCSTPPAALGRTK